MYAYIGTEVMQNTLFDVFKGLATKCATECTSTTHAAIIGSTVTVLAACVISGAVAVIAVVYAKISRGNASINKNKK